MAYGTVNADVIGTSVAGSNIGAGNASIMKNRCINGAMVIDQRNAGASVTANDNVYPVDRFSTRTNLTSKGTVQQSTDAPVGFKNSIVFTSTASTSLGASDYMDIVHFIEGYNIADLGWGTANAKTVTLSFWVKSSLTGTFGGVLNNANATRTYPFTYSIPVANTWTQISVTIVGDTTGTWSTDNGQGIKIWFGLGVGSTFSGTAGSWSGTTYLSATGATSVIGTSGATFYITGVQLEVGSSATGFEYRQYQQELALCQRYLPAIAGAGNIPGTGAGASTTQVYISIPFQVQTRVPATGITTSAMSTFSVGDGAANFTPTSIGFQSAGLSSGFLDINFASGPAFGRAYYFNAANSSMKLLFTGCEL